MLQMMINKKMRASALISIKTAKKTSKVTSGQSRNPTMAGGRKRSEMTIYLKLKGASFNMGAMVTWLGRSWPLTLTNIFMVQPTGQNPLEMTEVLVKP